jgi:hypothetical protein
LTSPIDALNLIAELSVGLAGFAGVASAFSGRDRDYRPTERIRFLAVLQASGTSMAACLAAVTLDHAGVPTATSFRLVAVAFLLIWIVVYLPLLRQAVILARDSESSSSPAAVVITVAHNLLLFAATLLQIARSDLTWPLIFVLSQQLVFGMWMFGRILMRPN